MNVAMVFITHDLSVASQICDDIVVMYRGEIVEFGPPSQIFRNPGHPYTASWSRLSPDTSGNPPPDLCA